MHSITPPYLDPNSHEAFYEIDVAAADSQWNSTLGPVKLGEALASPSRLVVGIPWIKRLSGGPSFSDQL